MNIDSAGIIKGASNLEQAKKFMDFLTGTEGQSLVGEYRIPANYKATTTKPIPSVWDSIGNPTSKACLQLIPAFFNSSLLNPLPLRVSTLFL